MDIAAALPIIMRWVHIGSAMVAVGAPFFVRFALMPAASQTLDPTAHQALRDAINARWRKVVYGLITLFLISGSYTFLVVAPWKHMAPDDRRLYHMLFGIKVLAAFTIFFLASALAGRTAGLAPFRKQAELWLGVLLLAAAVILVCSGLLRHLHDSALSTAPCKSGAELLHELLSEPRPLGGGFGGAPNSTPDRWGPRGE